MSGTGRYAPLYRLHCFAFGRTQLAADLGYLTAFTLRSRMFTFHVIYICAATAICPGFKYVLFGIYSVQFDALHLNGLDCVLSIYLSNEPSC